MKLITWKYVSLLYLWTVSSRHTNGKTYIRTYSRGKASQSLILYTQKNRKILFPLHGMERNCPKLHMTSNIIIINNHLWSDQSIDLMTSLKCLLYSTIRDCNTLSCVLWNEVLTFTIFSKNWKFLFPLHGTGHQDCKLWFFTSDKWIGLIRL